MGVVEGPCSPFDDERLYVAFARAKGRRGMRIKMHVSHVAPATLPGGFSVGDLVTTVVPTLMRGQVIDPFPRAALCQQAIPVPKPVPVFRC